MPKVAPKQLGQGGATDGQALVWHNATGAWVPVTLTHLAGIDVCFASDADPWISTKSSTPIIAARFLFRGTDVVGPLTSIKAIVEQEGTGVTGQVTIYDYTNANQIAQASDSSTPGTPTILNLGTIGNLPTTPAIFEVQIARTAGVANTRIGALCASF